MSSLSLPWGNVSRLKVEGARWRGGKWDFAFCCWRPVTINGLLTPIGLRAWSDYSSQPCPCVVRLPCPPPLRPHRQIRQHAAWLTVMAIPFLFFPPSSNLKSFLNPSLCCSSPLYSSLPRTNPVPMLSSPSSSHKQPELWVHSPLIQHQSYLSSGTIATEQAQLRTTACRKIAPLPRGCGTLRIQQRQPSSLSLLHIKSSSVRVEKRFQLLCAWLSSKWNFYYCSAIDSNSKWLISSVLAVALSDCWSTARLFVCSLRSCMSYLRELFCDSCR